MQRGVGRHDRLHLKSFESSRWFPSHMFGGMTITERRRSSIRHQTRSCFVGT